LVERRPAKVIRVRAGPDLHDGDRHHLRKSNLHRRSFKPILARAELPDMRVYDLRHSAASILLALGEGVKVVQERLHASVTLTLDTVQPRPGGHAGAGDGETGAGVRDRVRCDRTQTPLAHIWHTFHAKRAAQLSGPFA